MIPVIMSGGSGTRLWPLSRKMRPKQFISLTNERTMFQNTLDRLEGLSELEMPVVVCNNDHRFMVAEQLLGTWADSSTIILEPVGRNTAPAVALAAFSALKKHGGDVVLMVLAADHVVDDVPAFHAAIVKAENLAKQGHLVTFGIVANRPETGYGYIRSGEPVGDGFAVAQFVEKPNLETASEYVASGEYFWNSGMFMFQAGRYLDELKKQCPDIFDTCQASFESSTTDLDFVRIDKEQFSNCPDDSIDYAVMENTDDAVMVPLDAGWNDVGAWSALWDVGNKDADGNVLHGDVVLQDVKNSYVRAEQRLVSVVGVEDVVVVETSDSILVSNRDSVQDVKKIVAQLKEAGRSEPNIHRQVYRPWGHYDSIDAGDRYQVKRITVKPNEKLSLQMHHHRAEHWIVVSGTAKVVVGGEEVLLTENQSTYIPVGVTHCLENPGRIPLEIIEVQSGAYLGEDDIVRFNDIYGRIEK